MLDVLRPLLCEEEFKEIEKEMENFQQNEGPSLQKVLEQRYKVSEGSFNVCLFGWLYFLIKIETGWEA